MTGKESKTEADKKERQKLFFGLFVFPLLIAVSMAVLLCTVVLLTSEAETPESLITAIKTGAPSKRWQSAFELANELNSKDGVIRSAGIMNEIIHILNDQNHYDPKTRAYMAMALERYQDPRAEEALQKALNEVDESTEDAIVPIFFMSAIGSFQNPKASPAVSRFLESERPELRKTAAYVLGALGDPGMIPRLKPLLEDRVPDVRWNTALSLARLGDVSGTNVLMQMLDRSRLSRMRQMNEKRIERVMVNAAKGLGLIPKKEAIPILETVSKHDRNLKVRQATLTALHFQMQRMQSTRNVGAAMLRQGS